MLDRRIAGPILSRWVIKRQVNHIAELTANSAYGLFFGFICAIFLGGCLAGPPPIEEFTIARTALNAARVADSERYASGFWNKAEESYRLGQKAYQENDFKEAKLQFDRAREFAEKAENFTRLKKFQSGDAGI